MTPSRLSRNFHSTLMVILTAILIALTLPFAPRASSDSGNCSVGAIPSGDGVIILDASVPGGHLGATVFLDVNANGATQFHGAIRLGDVLHRGDRLDRGTLDGQVTGNNADGRVSVAPIRSGSIACDPSGNITEIKVAGEDVQIGIGVILIILVPSGIDGGGLYEATIKLTVGEQTLTTEGTIRVVPPEPIEPRTR